jgi:AraC family transcriptional regulator
LADSNAVNPFFDGPAIQSALPGTCLTLARMRALAPEVGREMTAPVEDAFGLVFQLGVMPAHEYRAAGRTIRIESAPSATVAILDLNLDVLARLDQPFDSLCLHIPRVALDHFTGDAGQNRVGRLAVDGMFATRDPRIAALAQPLVDLLGDGSPARPTIYADHLVLALLSHLVTAYGGASLDRRGQTGQLAPWQVRRAKEMLDGTAGMVALADVAAGCGLSLAHFSRAFKRSTGVAPYAWLQSQRMKRAKALLARGDQSLAQVAADAGFADQSHFTRNFTSLEGISPGAWRRQRLN